MTSVDTDGERWSFQIKRNTSEIQIRVKYKTDYLLYSFQPQILLFILNCQVTKIISLLRKNEAPPNIITKEAVKKEKGIHSNFKPSLQTEYNLHSNILNNMSCYSANQHKKLYRKIKMLYSILKSLAEYKYLTFILIHDKECP